MFAIPRYIRAPKLVLLLNLILTSTFKFRTSFPFTVTSFPEAGSLPNESLIGHNGMADDSHSIVFAMWKCLYTHLYPALRLSRCI